MRGQMGFNPTLMIALAALIAASTVLISKEAGAALNRDESVVGGLDYYHQTEFSSDPKNIYIENQKTGERRVIYTSQKEYIDMLTLSPNRELIAVIEPLDETTNTLLIISTEGKVIHSISDNVRRYDWNPDGDKIAYITGEYREGGFKPDSIYIFDLTTKEKLSITKDFPHPRVERYEGPGFYLKWAVHDGNLYIRDFDYVGGNYLYDPSTGKTRPVSHHGIEFSPDGKFYCDRGGESTPAIFVTATDENISDRIVARFGHLPTGWISGYPHHLRAVITEYEPDPNEAKTPSRPRVAWVKGTRKVIKETRYLYDVERDEVIDERTEKP